MQTNETKKVDDLKAKEIRLKKSIKRLNNIIDNEFNFKKIWRDVTWKT